MIRIQNVTSKILFFSIFLFVIPIIAKGQAIIGTTGDGSLAIVFPTPDSALTAPLTFTGCLTCKFCSVISITGATTTKAWILTHFVNKEHIRNSDQIEHWQNRIS